MLTKLFIFQTKALHNLQLCTSSNFNFSASGFEMKPVNLFYIFSRYKVMRNKILILPIIQSKLSA